MVSMVGTAGGRVSTLYVAVEVPTPNPAIALVVTVTGTFVPSGIAAPASVALPEAFSVTIWAAPMLIENDTVPDITGAPPAVTSTVMGFCHPGTAALESGKQPLAELPTAHSLLPLGGVTKVMIGPTPTVTVQL